MRKCWGRERSEIGLAASLLPGGVRRILKVVRDLVGVSQEDSVDTELHHCEALGFLSTIYLRSSSPAGSWLACHWRGLWFITTCCLLPSLSLCILTVPCVVYTRSSVVFQIFLFLRINIILFIIWKYNWKQMKTKQLFWVKISLTRCGYSVNESNCTVFFSFPNDRALA